MDHELNTEDIGEQLGTEGVGSVVSKVEAYCAYEEQRITLTNQPRIVALRAEASLLLDEERALADRLKSAPPSGDVRSRRRRAFYYGSITAFLTIAAFVFSLYSFEPFRLGLKGYLYCLGIAVVTPFLVDLAIARLKGEALITSLTTVACLAALTSLVLLDVVRGDLLAESMKDTNPVIIFDDAQPQAPPSENHFYEKATPLLQLVMALLAFAMELGAGIALNEARRMGSDSAEDWNALRSRLKEIHGRLPGFAFEITALQNEPKVFVARFWRNFYRAMLTHTIRNAMSKLLVALLVILVAVHSRAAAQSHTTLVIAVDLSQSVAVRGPDGKSEFQKNIEAVTKQLAQAPADSRVTVIGITDHSFTQPNILLSATIPADPGYFGERLKMARSELVRTWKTRSLKLRPRYQYTDIIGVLLLAEMVFKERSESDMKILVIYSDMRHSTPDLDLESVREVPSAVQMKISHQQSAGDLSEVQVFVAGVDEPGKSTDYWQSLRRFWTEYFNKAGAATRSYSVLRESHSFDAKSSATSSP